MADHEGPFSAESVIVYLADEPDPIPVAMALTSDGAAWAKRIVRALNAAHRLGEAELHRRAAAK